MALPDHARRRLRLHRHTAAHAAGPDHRRARPQGHRAGPQERLLLRGRPPDGGAHLRVGLRRRPDVGDRHRCRHRPADRDAGGAVRKNRARGLVVARPHGRAQLAAHVLESQHRARLPPRPEHWLVLRPNQRLRVPAGQVEHWNRGARRPGGPTRQTGAGGAPYHAAGVGPGDQYRGLACRVRGSAWRDHVDRWQRWCSGGRATGSSHTMPAPERSCGQRRLGRERRRL